MSSLNTSDRRASDTMEYDENGIPYYKWPPFPTPLPEAKIIPFKDFKPTGIQIQVLEGEVEIDGEGIPTVRLNAKHDGEDKPKKKKTKKHLTTEEAVSTSEWWKEWEAGEDLRSNFSYDDMEPMANRLSAAAEDFKKSRKWPPHARKVEFWWDTFQLFCGIIGYDARPVIRKFQDEDEAMDEDDSDEDPSGPKFTGPQSPQPITIQEYDPARHYIRTSPIFTEDEEEREAKRLRNFEEKERRLDNFLRNPETSIKIFFSSYFREKGWMWENAALRDCPRVVLFFLKFLARNRALPEIRRELSNAIAIAERAQDELPRTRIISMNVPDDFSLSCVHLFGSREPKTDWSTALQCSAGDDSLDEVRLDTEEKNCGEKGSNEMDDSSVRVPDEPTPQPPIEEHVESWDSTNWGAPSDSTWGYAGGWGDPPSNAVDAVQDAIKSWARPKYFLMDLLGPTSLPLTHKVGYVERSTRHIISCTMPVDAGPNKFPGHDLSMFAKVVFGCHRRFFNHDRAAIKKPELLEDPFTDDKAHLEGDVRSTDLECSKHDPGRDRITVYLLPEAAEKLIPRMNVKAIYVQVVPDRTWKDPAQHGLGASDNDQRQSDQVFWYIEKVEQILPSFWFERRSS